MSRTASQVALDLLATLGLLAGAFGCSVESGGPRVATFPSPLIQNREPSPFQIQQGSTVVHMTSRQGQLPANYRLGTYIDESSSWMRIRDGLLRTENGGRTWTLLKPETEEDEQLFGLIFGLLRGQLYFRDRTLGFFSSGTGIWKTIDRGENWRLISRGEITGLYFFNSISGWMHLSLERANRLYLQSYRTADGGDSWQPCGVLQTQDVGDILEGDFEYWPREAFFVDANIGWTITTRSVDRKKSDGILHTRDGGCSWTLLWDQERSSLNPDESFVDIYFVDQTHGWMAGGFVGGVYSTDDGGRTWQAVVQSPDPYDFPQINSIYFSNLTEGWLVATSNQIYPMMQSTDGGHSWTPISHTDIVNLELPTEWKAGQFVQILARSKNLFN